MMKNKIGILLIKYTKKILGVIFIIIGFFGLFLPFIQGTFLLLLGIILLGNKKLLTAVVSLKEYLQKKLHNFLDYFRQ